MPLIITDTILLTERCHGGITLQFCMTCSFGVIKMPEGLFARQWN